MTLRILVTGGAGYLGSVLCERLLDAGHYVMVLDSLIYQQNSLFHLCANQRFEFIHALYLAKGGNLRRMIAELYGKADGCAKGKGGSMHLIDIEARVMGASAVVGTTIPQAVGFAYAVKLQRKDSVVASFFGDGAVDEGVFHESLNFAALKELPIIFVCENNRYAIHTHQLKRQKLDNICDRARAHAYDTLPLPTKRLSGPEVLRFRDYAFDAYFTNSRYLGMITDKFGLETARDLKQMTGYQLERKYLGTPSGVR